MNNNTSTRSAAGEATSAALENSDLNVDGVTGTSTGANLKDSLNAGLHLVQEKTAVAKEKVSENLAAAAEQIHVKSDQTTGFLDKKADSFGEFAHETIGRANDLGHKAGDALASTSDFVKNFEFNEARKQVAATVRQHPGRALTIAGIFGLAIGLLIGRNSKSR
ncbi:MAG: hypothetical protein KIS76_15515 [Pyrinomonadaceae bacterium]|nr:hypothetical protein [Pyrinomonadaceae bacterium]